MAENKGNGKEQTTKFKEISILFPDELKKGQFANNVFIVHTSEEFVLDFLSVGAPVGSAVARIFLTPSHTKRLARALSENIERYEADYGKIKEVIQSKNPA